MSWSGRAKGNDGREQPAGTAGPAGRGSKVLLAERAVRRHVVSGDWPYPLWIAHRGAGMLAPENTLAAFRLGASYGYRAFECDVKLSADDVPFLLHDATCSAPPMRSAGRRAPWNELSQLDAGSWHSRLHAGEPLPSLAAVAAFVQRNGFALDIEIKPTPGTEAHTGAVVAAACSEAVAAPGTDTAAQFVPAPGAACGSARAHRSCAVHCCSTALAGRRGRAGAATGLRGGDHAARADGQPAGRADPRRRPARLVYTVNELERARQLQDSGIDGIVTDAVDRLSPA